MVGDVSQEIEEQTQKGKNIQGGKHYGVVTVYRSLESQKSETVQRKNNFRQKRPSEEDTHESLGKSRYDNQHGVSKNVAVEDPVFSKSFFPGRSDVLFVDLLKK